jgi:alkylhydroperoxidase/carboxymuconolactone decarboxylase family protein YurZ
MDSPRNIAAALASCTIAIADFPPTAVGLRAAVARCRLRDPGAMADFNTEEARALLEAAMAREPLPAGAVGEAVLAYLVALRRDVNPVPFAVAALQRFGADEGEALEVLSAWLHGAAERAAAQAAALQAEVARRRGAK